MTRILVNRYIVSRPVPLRSSHATNHSADGNHWYAGFSDDEAHTIAKANRGEESTGTRWVEVGARADLATGRVHAVDVGNRAVALVRTDDWWHALDGRCPHQGGPLTEGTLCGDDAI